MCSFVTARMTPDTPVKHRNSLDVLILSELFPCGPAHHFQNCIMTIDDDDDDDVHACVCAPVWVQITLKSRRGYWSPEFKLQVIVGCQMWVLGTELGTRSAYTLNH